MPFYVESAHRLIRKDFDLTFTYIELTEAPAFAMIPLQKSPIWPALKLPFGQIRLLGSRRRQSRGIPVCRNNSDLATCS